MKTRTNSQKIKQISALVAELSANWNSALDSLTEKAIAADTTEELDSIEAQVIRAHSYKRGYQNLSALLDSDSANVASALLSDARRTLRVKDFAKFAKLVSAIQSHSRNMDSGAETFMRALQRFNRENVERGELETSLARFGRQYKNNVASGERLLRALGLHSAVFSGKAIVGFADIDLEGYKLLAEISGFAPKAETSE